MHSVHQYHLLKIHLLDRRVHYKYIERQHPKLHLAVMEYSMKVKIVAEIAQGFEGQPEQAHLLLKAASKAGADAAKFQLVYFELVLKIHLAGILLLPKSFHCL